MIVNNEIVFFSNSLIGPRKENEDFFRVESMANKFIATVADGVGGRRCGSLASRLSVNLFHEKLFKADFTDLRQLLEKVNLKLIKESLKEKDCEGMATTFTSCIIEKASLEGIHVGDTRLCLLRGNGIKELTYEHSEVARLYRSKLLTVEQYINYPRRNIIESALGLSAEFVKQSFKFSLQPQDRIILSSDGFHTLFTKLELRNYSAKSKSLLEFKTLVDNELSLRKLKDNCTYILIQIP